MARSFEGQGRLQAATGVPQLAGGEPGAHRGGGGGSSGGGSSVDPQQEAQPAAQPVQQAPPRPQQQQQQEPQRRQPQQRRQAWGGLRRRVELAAGVFGLCVQLTVWLRCSPTLSARGHLNQVRCWAGQGTAARPAPKAQFCRRTSSGLIPPPKLTLPSEVLL